MDTDAARNQVKVMVVIDLAAICWKLAENSAVPDDLRAEARELLEEFEELLPSRGRGTLSEQSQGEFLLAKMARFLPRIIEVSNNSIEDRQSRTP
jgi:hypothetical protein